MRARALARTPWRIAVLAVVAVGVACKSGDRPADAADPEAVRQALRELIGPYERAVLAGDVAAIAGYHAADGISLQADGSAAENLEALQALLREAFAAATVTEVRLGVDDRIVASGDLVVAHGTYDYTVTPRGGTPQAMRERWLAAFRREPDGSLRIVRDMNQVLPGGR